jgi:protein pelota
VARETVRAACDDVAKADVLAVVLQEGLAHVCAVTNSRTVLLNKVEGRVGGKGRGGEREKALGKFYERVADAVEKGWRENYKACVLAGPGWVGQSLSKVISEKGMKDIAGKVVLAHASSGHLHALSEALAGQEVEKAIGEMKEAGSTKALTRFEDILRKDEGRAWYGPGEVEKAIGMGAVGRGGGLLLVSDVLFRADEVGMRQKWVALVEKVKEEGGEAFVFSSQHGSGRRLEGLGGVAAILTFPLEDLDVDEEEQAETKDMD